MGAPARRRPRHRPRVAACKPKGESPERLVACLRGQGLEPPTAIEELKPWIGRQFDSDAGKTTLRACGLEITPKDKVHGTPGEREKRDCGGAEYPKDQEAAERQ